MAAEPLSLFAAAAGKIKHVASIGLVKGTAPEKIVPDKTLSDGGGAPEHQSLKPRTAELAQTPVWWESTRKWEKQVFF